MKYINQKNLFIICCLLISSSCKKFVTIPGPKNQIVTSQVFADSTDANAALVGIYINMMNTSLGLNSGGMSVFPALSADELYQTANNTEYNQFYVDNILPTNNTDNGFWISAYKYIYSVNECIEEITASKGISATASNEFIAEAKFIRAFEYFYLVNLYGGVPLVTSTNYQVNASLPRVSPDQIYRQIISDLQFAEANLPAYAGVNTRPTSSAASALLAKVYLFDNKYDLAQTESSKVIKSGYFSIVTDLNAVFLNSSTETIWQMAPVTQGLATSEGFNFIPSSASAIPRYVITPILFNSFEPGDGRQTQWIQSNTVNGTAYPYPFKYKQATAPGGVNEYEVVIRLADLFLIRSEAEANQGDEVDAINDLNVIRNRAGLPNANANDKASVLLAIQNERRKEFFCEWANRWLDLKRLNVASAILSPLKPGWNANDQLYPIPLYQLNTAPNLIQNPGY